MSPSVRKASTYVPGMVVDAYFFTVMNSVFSMQKFYSHKKGCSFLIVVGMVESLSHGISFASGVQSVNNFHEYRQFETPCSF